jgi:glycosyltransferase involved in cell wall biosynthesis
VRELGPDVEVLGERGTYFQAGDAADLKRALQECLLRVDLMRVQSESLQAAAIHEYDWDRVARQTLDVYLEICAR